MNEMKILIIEDNYQVRQMLRRFVEDLSDEIREVEDGVFALDAYREFMPDWVLMDFEMKEVNGIEASKQIIAEYPNAKIVMVTNHNNPSLKKTAEKMGLAGFVLKENLSELREILH